MTARRADNLDARTTRVNITADTLGRPSGRFARWFEPSRRAASIAGLIGVGLVLATTLLEIVFHGLHIESWGTVSGCALVLVPSWCGVLNLTRYRNERRTEWLLFSIGSFGWAFGQLLWIAQITIVGSTTWPSFSDIGYLLWPIAAISRRTLHVRPFERSTRVLFMVDALVLAVALSFVAWEVIIRAGVGDPARFSLPAQLAMLIYPLTDIVLASMLGLLLLIGRSPARIGLFVGAVLLTIADIGLLGHGRRRRPTRRRSPCRSRDGRWRSRCSPCPPACPSGGVVRYTRPTLSRLLVVHLPVMAAVWLAAWRYMFTTLRSDHRHDRDRCARRVVDHRRAVGHVVPLDDVVRSAQRQHRQPSPHRGGTPRPARRPSRLGDRARRQGRIVEANKLALDITGRSHSEVLNKTFTSLVRPGGPADAARRLGRDCAVGEPCQQPGVPVRPSRRSRDPAGSRCSRADTRPRARRGDACATSPAGLREAHDLDLAQERFRAGVPRRADRDGACRAPTTGR